MSDTDTDSSNVEELLPWYVNGTLTAEEEREVRDYILGNEPAEREVALLKQLRQAVRSQEFQPPGSFGLQRLRTSIAREPAAKARPGGRGGRWMPLAAAAAIAVIVLQGVLLWESRYRPAEYEPAGSSEDRPYIQVRFEPGATESQVRTLLLEAGLEIVKGPGASGVYRLATVATDSDVAQIVDWLRRRDEIVSFVEEN
ncbi:MAG: hypothetical protein U5R46_18905 [Gammaproteobacteria bacterium]|nr:hypothetical protein [Gammaproteobacteria bacterium]